MTTDADSVGLPGPASHAAVVPGGLAIQLVSPAGGTCRCDLLPGRAAYLPARRTLLVADLHLGKAATFRRAGLPVPEGSSAADLAGLKAIVASVRPARIIVLGDLFHAASGCTPAVFEEWRRVRDGLAAEILLVPGNHDRRLRLPVDLGLSITGGPLLEDGLSFHHEPPDASPESVAFCGHLHPRLAIRAPSGDRCTERCFVAREGLLVLPAFASFAGASVVRSEPGVRLWAAGPDAVIEVTRMARLAADATSRSSGMRAKRTDEARGSVNARGA